MKPELVVVFFRQDLRLYDNLALLEASKFKKKILPIYIFDSNYQNKIGSVSKIWLHNSLQKLDRSLNKNLNIYQGDITDIFTDLLNRYNIISVFWNKCYEPDLLAQENDLQNLLDKNLIKYQAYNSNFLWHPEKVLKDDSSYYKVYTAYKNKAYTKLVRDPFRRPESLDLIKDNNSISDLFKLELIPKKDWHEKIFKIWEVGEDAAKIKLEQFLQNNLENYANNRNRPDLDITSKLSPHLHFGEISPVQIYHATKASQNLIDNVDSDCFLNEIVWREFSTYLLYHFKDLETRNFNSKFDLFPWIKNTQFLKLWQKGKTGYPIIDAGMRELWQTGFMHNRVRMIVASFLVKNLNIHWKFGRDWFDDCLVDADMANNNASWQWVAGCGADAAPYFRIFNPITQGEKFDKNGEYTKKYVPELSKMPLKYLFNPSSAPKNILSWAGVNLGENYPKPIVDLAITRNKALAQYKQL